MKIALVHYRAGLMDGVSLEMEKWKKVLKGMGNEVAVIAGNDAPGVDIRVDFLSLESDEKSLEKMKEELERILEGFDVVIVENIWSLGLKVELGLALEDIAKSSKSLFIGHHHDFWWERGMEGKVLEEHFPPDLPNVHHVVINTLARDELKRRRGIESVVIPNVIDTGVFKDLKSDLRERIGISDGDLVFLQATRVVRRKAIEIAVDLVSEFSRISKDLVGKKLYKGDPFSGRAVLALGGMIEDREYMDFLKKYAEEKGVEMVYVFPELKGPFWEIYTVGDFVTYPSIWEGWGNQLLEALAAKKPVALFEYEVFRRDIKKSGIEYVSLGKDYSVVDGRVVVEKSVIERAAEQVAKILFSKELYESIVEKNFRIVDEKFSLKVLEKLLPEVIG